MKKCFTKPQECKSCTSQWLAQPNSDGHRKCNSCGHINPLDRRVKP
jgi:hypothetical protein